MALLLPLWRQVARESCAVVIVRDPLEVAQSLHRRNGLPLATGLALWSVYNRALLRDLRGARVYLCRYDELLTNPADTLRGVFDSLRAWDELPDGVDPQCAVQSVRPDLRRNTGARDAADPSGTPEEITQLMNFFVDHTGRHESFDVGAPPEPGWWEGPLLDERRTTLLAALAVIATLEGDVTSLQTESDILSTELEEANRQLELVWRNVNRVKRLLPTTLYRSFVKKVAKR